MTATELPTTKKQKGKQNTKTKRTSLKAGVPKTPASDVAPAKEEVREKPTEQEAVGLVSIEIPLMDVVSGYQTNRCDIARMTAEQSLMLRKLKDGLIAKEAKLANGKIVRVEQDVFKWILEAINNSLMGKDGKTVFP